ncbi:polygalacturonate 4-alpha-galacturonosyltransferase-like isoform X2 [Macadamia integrifolia]|uniref:polygalacturonate 4-alpha-galacturonosyltransferase-like isoform X2 n=1 Tax=Macadamia integrifolia TaxID=60698 RepID=UPI001C4EA397|nr:polygalacturonate 4-alpha-galacturonosyltransferase-like isoform X2 [Macadamia integrifolia]
MRTKIKLHVKKLVEITEDPDGIQTGTNVQPNQIITGIERDTPQVKLENVTTDDNAQILDKPEKIARRQLREKRREKGAAELVHQDTEAIIKLENSAIEHSKAVDSSVLGKYCLLRRENENENLDSTIRLMRDQMIMARVYATIARMKNKLDLYLELSERLKESQCALGDANTDADLGRSAPEKIKAMSQVLSKAREQLYDCKLVTQKLRVMLQSADEQVRLCLKKQSTFLSQLATKTVPNGIHCLSMRLTISYYLLPPEKRKFPRSENPNLYHYALFSDNVLAASVVVNSTIMNVKGMEATFTVTVDDIECAYFDKVDGLCGFGAQNRESIAQLIWGFLGFLIIGHFVMTMQILLYLYAQEVSSVSKPKTGQGELKMTVI